MFYDKVKLDDLLGLNFAKSLTIHIKPKKCFLSSFCSYTHKVWILVYSPSVELVAKFFELFSNKEF
jgi:hypothetical protein